MIHIRFGRPRAGRAIPRRHPSGARRVQSKPVLPTILALGLALGFVLDLAAASSAGELPVRHPALDGLRELAPRVTNLFSQEMLLAGVADGDAKGLSLDLSRVGPLLDGRTIDHSKISGSLWVGPYPLSDPAARWEVVQFRSGAAVREGRATVPIASVENTATGWRERGQAIVRAQLTEIREGQDRDLGVYEFLVGFRLEDGIYRRAVTVTEGPFLAAVRGEGGSALITLRTEPPAEVTLFARDPQTGCEWRVASSACSCHELELCGLTPDRELAYTVLVDGWTSGQQSFRTAPASSRDAIRFAYCGDSRSGPGGGARAFMGVNALVLGSLLRDVASRDVRFLLHGGDLVSGSTSSPEDFRAQLRAFKWTATPFLRRHPIYSVMGNHDAAIRSFEDGSRYGISLDFWPYATESSEAIFAEEFAHPRNGPVPSDPRRPPYAETVYSFRAGLVAVIVMNNNYWAASHPSSHGGSPEGFFFPDQIAWLRQELQRAEEDPAVRWTFICFHEPPFPNSVHHDDAMWYDGDTRVRGAAVPAGSARPVPESQGIIEVRNEILRLAASTRKVVALLGSDEHDYSRLLLTPETPAGDPARDDRDGDGILDAPLSPVPGLARPLWFITSGGAGAPHYPEVEMPWNAWWKERAGGCPEPDGCYRFSMLNHWVLFEARENGVALETWSTGGDLLDRVEDLARACQR